MKREGGKKKKCRSRRMEEEKRRLGEVERMGRTVRLRGGQVTGRRREF